MKLTLDLKTNALDSFNEALVKFESSEQGDTTALKFAILHLSHCIELVLKMYVQTLNEELIFEKCYKVVRKKANSEKIDPLAAYKSLQDSNHDFSAELVGVSNPFTISVTDALSLAKHEICSTTGNKFMDDEFVEDIEWMKQLRNEIEHYEFSFTAKEVRLCIGRLVRGLDEFTDLFSLFNLEQEIGTKKIATFQVLVDEYEQTLSEAYHEVKEVKRELFRGTKPSEQIFIEWNVYDCGSCGNYTLVPNASSWTGYRCTYCQNEESEEIEVNCDVCGLPFANGEMISLGEDLTDVCPRCANPEAY